MNQRDLAAIRRRLNPEDRLPSVIRGCYVGSDGQIMSTFTKNVATLPQAEFEKYAALFKKTLTGTQGQNLVPVSLAEEQASDTQLLLSQLCRGELREDAEAEALCQRIITAMQADREAMAQSVDAQRKADNQLILMLYDCMDVFRRHPDGEEDREESDQVFNYILCAVCPVKQGKPSLSWFAEENDFHSRPEDWSVSMPDMGFLYPSMENGGADVSTALFYTRAVDDLHASFMHHVFHTDGTMTASEQLETFQSVLTTALEQECSMDVVQAVHERVSGMIQEQKENKNAEPLTLGRNDIIEVLETCGVSAEKAEAFDQGFSETFGEHAELPAVNIVQAKQYKVSTPGISITVAPDRSDLVLTRIIDGLPYILIRAEGEVQVNGIPVNIGE